MVNFNFYKNCYGCRNCENVCPAQAIKMIENEEGFLVPNIDKNKCINCGRCDKACPYLNYKEKNDLLSKEWYGMYNKKIDECLKSSSGAIFPAISNIFIEAGGEIVGCIWSNNMEPIHVCVSSKEEVDKMRGSKYVQSDLKDIVKIVKERTKHKKILFTGTPCQIAAVKGYVGENENLYTCALICEGVPSNRVWQKYKSDIEKKYNSKMIKANFRNKEISWESPLAVYEFENGKISKNMSFNSDEYVVAFLEGLMYRESCYNCQYKGNGHNADIIIGDLWGATKEQKEMSKNKGISLVIINTEKGKEILEKINDTVVIENVDKNRAIENNKLLMQPIKKHENKIKFYNKIDKMKISKNFRNNLNKTILKGKLKNYLYKIGIFEKIKNRVR